jgi:hypothetical protein
MLPVQQLYQHVKTKDPKLYQALDAICQSINAPTIAGVATVIATAAIPIEGGTTTGAAAGVTYSLGMQGTLAIATDIAPKVYIPATFVPSVELLYCYWLSNSTCYIYYNRRYLSSSCNNYSKYPLRELLGA